MSLINDGTEEKHNCATPWNLYYQKAQAGDIKAEYCIYTAADPFIVRLTRVPYFRDRLGKDEIRSICYFALVKWVRRKQELPPDPEVPFLIRSVLRLALVYFIRQQDARAEYEQPAVNNEDFASEEDETVKNPMDNATTDSADEPESKCLHNAFRMAVRDAVEQLPKEEKEMIHAQYFQHKSMKEIAQELNCTCQFAYQTRHRAFLHLKKLLVNCSLS